MSVMLVMELFGQGLLFSSLLQFSLEPTRLFLQLGVTVLLLFDLSPEKDYGVRILLNAKMEVSDLLRKLLYLVLE